MATLNIHSHSVWSQSQIEQYLSTTIIPIRLAFNGTNGFPIICSMWFLYDEGNLWCAAHEQAVVIEHLQHSDKCGFEIAHNQPPYRGVRGQGHVEMVREKAKDVLTRLTERYLTYSNQELKNWLLSRTEHEYALRLEPSWLTSWDYTDRMSD